MEAAVGQPKRVKRKPLKKMPRNKNISRKRSLILLNNLEAMDERRKTININGSMRETGDPNMGNFRSCRYI